MNLNPNASSYTSAFGHLISMTDLKLCSALADCNDKLNPHESFIEKLALIYHTKFPSPHQPIDPSCVLKSDCAVTLTYQHQGDLSRGLSQVTVVFGTSPNITVFCDVRSKTALFVCNRQPDPRTFKSQEAQKLLCLICEDLARDLQSHDHADDDATTVLNRFGYYHTESGLGLTSTYVFPGAK